MIRPGDTQFELVTPEEFNIFGIVVSQGSLHEVAQKQGIMLDSTAFNSPLRVWQSKKLSILRYVLNELLKPEHAGISRPIQEENLIMAVLDVLQQNDGQIHEKPSFTKRRAVVEKVSAYLEAHPDKPVTITELCELTHVSRRTMQYCFEDVLGISPLRCIRISRLNAVRRRLLQGLEEGETISMVAQQWGFLHAGQFTHDYTLLFGENPSVTLMRSQN
jgi:AraC family ethanolamine operon transcriptional activator